MTEPSSESDAVGESNPRADDDSLAEMREAAAVVVQSLRQLLDATERVVHDPDAFHTVVTGGRSLVEAFTSGFIADWSAPESPDDTAGGA